jgi:2-aminoadipate transaminase
VEKVLETARPKLLILTPSFQNPTGASIPEEARRRIAQSALKAGVALVENNIYGALRYTGTEIAPLKKLDASGNTIQIGSFSKVAFPGLRVGWVVGPRVVMQRLGDAKQRTDLHTDQLSQAVLLNFLESGRLEKHLAQMILTVGERLRLTLEACERWLPKGTAYTRPEGGMNLWVELPEALDANEVLASAIRQGVTYMPGRYFSVTRPHTNALRLSFAGLRPHEIDRGLRILGRVFDEEQDRAHGLDPAPAMV